MVTSSFSKPFLILSFLTFVKKAAPSLTVDIAAVREISATEDFIYISWISAQQGSTSPHRLQIELTWRKVKTDDIFSAVKKIDGNDDIYDYLITSVVPDTWYFVCFKAVQISLAGSSEVKECDVVKTSTNSSKQSLYQYEIEPNYDEIVVMVHLMRLDSNAIPYNEIEIHPYIQELQNSWPIVDHTPVTRTYTYKDLTPGANYTVCIWVEFSITSIAGSAVIEENCEVITTNEQLTSEEMPDSKALQHNEAEKLNMSLSMTMFFLVFTFVFTTLHEF